MALSKITNASVADTAVHGRRNLIINGAMQVAQRGTSSAAHTSGFGCVDRFKSGGSLTTGAVTMSQSTDAPDGFAYSLKMDVTTANTSLAAGEYYIPCTQVIEAQNLQHLNYGTSEAKQFTVSFWVKSNKTGTYTLEAYNHDSTLYINTKPYTINDADTWEYKTITFEANTNTAATIANDNGLGIVLNWWVAAGSTYNDGTGTLLTGWNTLTNNKRATGVPNMMDSTSNEWLITGVKLEVGNTATPFLHESYAENLDKCKRYMQVIGDASNTQRISDSFGWTTTIVLPALLWPKEMRATPTFSTNDVTKGNIEGNVSKTTTNIQSNVLSKQGGTLYLTTSGLTEDYPYMISMSAGGYLYLDAEL